MAARLTRKKRKPEQNTVNVFWKYCFAIVFSISILGQYPLELFQTTGNAVPVAHGKASVSDNSGGGTHHPVRLPIGTEPDNTEVPKDESESHTEKDGDFWFSSSVPESNYWYSIEKSPLNSFISHVENRETVSLVILHHSWKSFLS